MKCRVGILALLLGIGVLMFTSGCGSNLFVNLDDNGVSSITSDAASVQSDSDAEGVIANIDEALNDDLSTADYKKLQDAADSLIENPALSDSVKDDARKLKGESGLGALGITPLDLASDLIETASSNSNQDITPSEFLSKLGLSDDVTQDSIKNVANAYNGITDDSVLTSSNYTSKAVANTVVVVKSIETVYDIDSNEFKGSPRESLAELVSEDDYNMSIVDYASASIDAFEKSGSLEITDNTEDLKSGIDDFKVATEEMVELNDAVVHGSTYTYNGTTYDFSGDDDQDNTLIETAFANIIEGGN